MVTADEIVAIVHDLDGAMDELSLASYVDGRTHASLPPGHQDRLDSWSRASEARLRVEDLLNRLRTAAVSS